MYIKVCLIKHPRLKAIVIEYLHWSPDRIVNLVDNKDARGVGVFVVENGRGDTSSNPGRDWLYFT